ncbi:MAG: hypothetical protein ACOX52_17985 [Verrucomicrobiota bacterium]
MEPTHPERQVENATAPSAGGSPDGENSRRGAEGGRGNVFTSEPFSATALLC